MKLSHIVLAGTLLFISYTMQSQTAPAAKKDEKTATEQPKVTYEELKELYIKMENSESHKLSNKLMKAFMEKMNYKEKDISVIQSPNGMLEWIKANIEKTGFASYEDAVKEYEEMMAATMKSTTENMDFYMALGKADPEDAHRILTEGINPYSED